ncbi:hypothetical protein FOXG_20677 [Fusarium oxysporum f. sp. lycopersici 4287]|uniref:Uncharacterized protein n=1 Tax=Fusarium oxysporum f. sp. lycopersici (strain 4287 / CBS 123668 / FGSC 9935 / NRRL 34936) TaxID=426428 RepID=A0A0J9WRH6_FUSO4|nr:hypothetical protein FOXG_20677 [Fusarium oxysporum f. sp. lycopersici 4287]KNB12547.1 hypothetical protein FOXG_20677 [Fusarium oxysporum f. sp. lycopersici 4287]
MNKLEGCQWRREGRRLPGRTMHLLDEGSEAGRSALASRHSI